MRNLFLLLAALVGISIQAQHVRLVARNTADSVVLRWAASDPAAWRASNVHGYRVERLLINERTSRSSKWTTVGPERHLPLSLEAMKLRYAADHPWAGAVAQLLHGRMEGTRTPETDLVAAARMADAQTMEWSMCMLVADMDATMADALGLRCVDRNAAPDANYLYRVIALDATRPDTAVVAVNRAWGEDPVPHGPAIWTDEREGKVQLRWEAQKGVASFSAYWVERSSDGKSWQRLNRRPYVPTGEMGKPLEVVYWMDTTITANYQPMRYRVLGITPFGDVSADAPVVTAMGRDRTPPAAPEITAVKDERGKLVVHWDQPAPVTDLKGYAVEKSQQSNGMYYPLHNGLLPPSARQFTDTSTFLLGENHYRIAAIDTAGNRMNSNPGYGFLIDSIAPAPPTGLSGSIDSSGVVTVRWRLGKEMDILGYRVFFANAPDHAFNNLSPQPVADTTFTDTLQLRTLTKRIHYKVVAVDRNFNHSGLSAMLTLTRPDVIAPAAPVMKRYTVSDSAVLIDFVPSHSKDVSRHELLRRIHPDTAWSLVSAIPAPSEQRTWLDQDVSGPAYYAYSLVAVDSAGNRSAHARPMEVRVPRGSKRPGATEVSAVAVDGRTVQVSWKHPPAPVRHYLLLRSKEGAPPVAIGSAPRDARTFTDIRLPGKGSYTYMVQAVFPDGGAAPIATAYAAVVLP
ncbi:MAG: hypothetical protein IPK70_00200 [Flavobacteriales bacterium]|jgi:hypothetical protein|nr:hypothetical protein [Flavobacteriales bacterium]